MVAKVSLLSCLFNLIQNLNVNLKGGVGSWGGWRAWLSKGNTTSISLSHCNIATEMEFLILPIIKIIYPILLQVFMKGIYLFILNVI